MVGALAFGLSLQGSTKLAAAAVEGVHSDAAAGVAQRGRALRVPQGDHQLPAQQGVATTSPQAFMSFPHCFQAWWGEVNQD